MLNPQTLSNEIWEAYEIWEAFILENFKPPLLAKFDGHNNPYEYVTSIYT